MKTFRVTTFNSNIDVKRNKKRKILESTAILAGSTAVIPTSFLIADNFSNNKKNYLKSVKNEKEIFTKTVQKNTDVGVGLLKKMGKPIDDNVIKTIKDQVEITEKSKLEEKLALLNKLRKSHVNKGLKISVGVGLSLGAAILGIKNVYEKQKNQSVQVNSTTQNYNNKITSDNSLSFGNKKKQISFTGIVDKIADGLTPQQLKNWQDYVNGLFPTLEETKWARKIADFRLKDWPKCIINSYIAKYLKPSTDREYHTYLLKQDIIVPSEPPSYYRNYDKWFNTQRWKDFQKWPDYIDKAAQFERMESIIKQERIKSYALEKARLEQAAKKELSAACVKYQINEEFLSAFNSDNKKVKIPDALMIQSKSKEDATETLKWIVGKSNSNYIYIEDKNESNYTRLDQILTVLEEAEENYKKNGKRTLVWVENFDKLLSKDSDNEEVIGDLKDMLDKISKQYKTTIIFSCNNTENLNPIALQPHRVKIYNIDKEAPLEELQKIQNNYILSNIQKIKNSDGYRFKYVPFEQNFVDLYLGDFSYSSNVLWVDSQNTEAIQAVIKNFDIIKMIPKFKNIKSIKFPRPNNINELDNNKLRCTGNITMDGKVIYEYFV